MSVLEYPGEEDCLHGEDENPPEGCANVTRSTNVVLGLCSPHQFQCKNGICLSPEWVKFYNQII